MKRFFRRYALPLVVLTTALAARPAGAEFSVSLYDTLQQFRVSAPPEQGAASASLSGSRNETVSVQAVLFNESGQALDGIRVESEGLGDVKTNVFAAGAVRVDTVTPFLDFPAGRYFDLLRPAGEESVASKAFQPYWIDFIIPRDARPGTLDGKLTFTAGNKSRTVSVRLHVRRPILPTTPTLPVAFAFVRGWIEQYYGRTLTEKELFECYDAMLEHRLGPVPMWGSGKDFYNEKTVRHCAERGMNVFIVTIGGQNKEAVDQSIAGTEPKLKLLREAGGLDKAYLFGYDEILMQGSAEKQLPWMRAAYEGFHERNPKTPRLATSWPDKRLDDFTDIYVVPVGHYRAEMSVPKAIWWYSVGNAQLNGSPDFRIDFPPLIHRYFFLASWRAGVDGQLYWAMHREWPFNKELHEKDRVEHDWIPSYASALSGNRVNDCGAGNLFYPGGKKQVVLPSVRVKRIRDGINDYEYLAQLRATVESLRKQRPSGWEKMVGEANDLLNFAPDLQSAPEARYDDWQTQFARAKALFGIFYTGAILGWDVPDHPDAVSLSYHRAAVRNDSAMSLRILPRPKAETSAFQELPAEPGKTYSTSAHVKTDDMKGKAFLKLEYRDKDGKVLQAAESDQFVSGSTGAKTFKPIEARLPAAPKGTAVVRVSLVAALNPEIESNTSEPLAKAFFEDVAVTADGRTLQVANPGFDDKYRMTGSARTDLFFSFREKLVDCLERACDLLKETGPFEHARPGRDR